MVSLERDLNLVPPPPALDRDTSTRPSCWKMPLTWINFFIQSLYACVLINKKVGKGLITNTNLCLEKVIQCRDFSTGDNFPALPNQTGAKWRKEAHCPSRNWTLDPKSSNPCTTSQHKWTWLDTVQSEICLGLPLDADYGFKQCAVLIVKHFLLPV